MWGYRNIGNYLIKRTPEEVIIQKIIAIAHRNNGEYEYSNKDLKKLEKLANFFADSKDIWLRLNSEVTWIHYRITRKFFNLGSEIDFFEKHLKYAVK